MKSMGFTGAEPGKNDQVTAWPATVTDMGASLQTIDAYLFPADEEGARDGVERAVAALLGVKRKPFRDMVLVGRMAWAETRLRRPR